MSWAVLLSKNAARQLKRLPNDRQQRMLSVLQSMRENPLDGDVVFLKGKQLKDQYRKRVGRYRIIFSLRKDERTVDIVAILKRDERTYR